MCKIPHPSGSCSIYTSQHNEVAQKSSDVTQTSTWLNSWGNASVEWCSCTHIKGCNRLAERNIKCYIPLEDWSPYSADNVSNWERLEHYGNSYWCRPEPQSLQASKRRLQKHGNQFFCQHFKILWVWCLTNRKHSLRTKKTLFHTNSRAVDMDSNRLASVHCYVILTVVLFK